MDVVRRIAAEKRGTPAQLALAWVIAQKPWIVPIPATTKLHRLEENIGGTAIALSTGELAEIAEATPGIDVKGDRYAAANQAPIDR